MRKLGRSSNIGIVAALVLLSACSTANQVSSTKPVSGGTLIVTYKDDPRTTDPAIGYDVTSYAIEHAVYNGLLTYKGASTAVVPDIAEAMPSITNGGKRYTFKLRHGVKFSNDREVTADDFKYSWERMLNPTTQGPMTGGPFWSGVTGAQDFFNGKANQVSGIKVIDRYTLEVDLDAANQSFLNVLAMEFAAVVPKEAVAAEGQDFARKPVGTGPFVFDRWVPGQILILKRNATYFGKAPYINEIDVQLGVDDQLGYLRLQNGQADVVDPGNNIPSAQYIQLSSNPAFKDRILRQTSGDLWFLAMDVNLSPFDKQAVRQAFNEIVNKQNLVKVLNGRATINNGLYPPIVPGYVPNYNPLGLDSKGQNLSKARALLAQAGYGPSHPFPAQDLVYPKLNQDWDNLAASIQQDFQQAGVTLNLKGLSFPAYLDSIGKPTTPLSFIQWIMDFPDPSDFYDPLLSCATAIVNGSNPSFFCDKQTDALADQARGDTNRSERLKLYQQMQNVVIGKDYPWLPLFSSVSTSISSTRVHDYGVSPVWPLDVTGLWLSK